MKWNDKLLDQVLVALQSTGTVNEALAKLESEGLKTTWAAIKSAFKKHRGLSSYEIFKQPKIHYLDRNLKVSDPPVTSTSCTACKGSGIVPGRNEYEVADCSECENGLVTIKPKLTRILIIPDCHIPFEDKRAYDLMLKVAKAKKPDIIAMLGDYADLYSVSRYAKDPNRVSQFSDEVAAVNARLDELDAIGASRKIFCGGNHEARLKAFLESSAGALFNHTSIEKEFKLAERGWEYYPHGAYTTIGKLHITHNVGSGGPSEHIKAGAAFEGNVVCGHNHSARLSYFGNATGASHVCATLGWLGDRTKADYASEITKLRNWQHGFGWAYMEADGVVHLQFIPLIDNSCVVDGELFNG